VYRAIVEIDGGLFAAPVLDGNGGRCADAVPSTPGPYEFQHRVPCKLRVADAQVPVDTRGLSEGPHTLRVWVEDAAGNRTSAAGPRTIGVADATGQQPSQHDVQQDTQTNATASTASNTASTSSSGLNGAPGGAGAKLTVWHSGSKRTIRVRYGRRVTLTGELLLPTGQPVAGAIVDVLSQARVRGSALRHVTTVRTDASGRFRYVAPAGPSRLIRFGYRAHLGDTAFSHTTDIHLRVVARLSFGLSAARLHNGQILRYGGRLAGPMSARKFVEIRVKKGSRWELVGVARTDSRGMFMWRYRFRRTFRPTTYAFRAAVRRQDGLPYEPSRTSVRRVRVVP
jgi:protocatechuate 3,4-dioxygenase beta subunit